MASVTPSAASGAVPQLNPGECRNRKSPDFRHGLRVGVVGQTIYDDDVIGAPVCGALNNGADVSSARGDVWYAECLLLKPISRLDVVEIDVSVVDL